MTSPNLPVLFLFQSLLALLSVPELHAVLRIQRITLFSDNCCKGRNETFTLSSKNLEEISDIVASGRMKSFSVHRGLWALYPFKNYNGSAVHQEGNDDDAVGNCGSSATGSGTYINYKSMRYIGNPILVLPGLSLFSKSNFMGDELYFDGKELRLSNVFQFRSYGFTGKESWTIMPNPNNTINSSCLMVQHKAVSFLETPPLQDHTMVVAVIRRGCSKTKSELRSGKHIQVQNGLKLYAKENRVGSEIFTDGIELRLPVPVKLESYSYIGTKNWTIFTGTKFDGDSDCLVNLKDSSSINQKVVVGSIKRGCAGDAVAEIVTPPPEVSDKQTDTNFGVRTVPSFVIVVLLPLGFSFAFVFSCQVN